MKTLIICIMAAVISTSNGSFLSFLLGDEGQNQRSEPQKFLHHHHHHHEVLHKLIVEDHHPLEISSGIHEPVEVHPGHIQIYKISHEHGGHGHHGVGLGYGYGHSHGPVYHHAPPHVITKVVHPVLHKNFIHNTHVHHYHKHHVDSGSGHHYHHGNCCD